MAGRGLTGLIQIAPSILNADLSRLPEELYKIRQADWLHLDIMDGHFVPNLSFGPALAKAVGKLTSLPMEAHLMVESPERFIEGFAKENVKRIIVHAESSRHLHGIVTSIKELGCEAGVALNPTTPPEVLEYILSELSVVLLMSVNPGFGGQLFLPLVLPKLERVRKMIDDQNLSCALGVDGGINMTTAPQAVAAGADLLIAGTFIYHSDDPTKVINDLKAIAGRKGV